MMRILDNKRNRIIIAVVVLLISITITSIVSFSNDTLPDYVIVDTKVSRMFDKLSSENDDNTIFEKYFVADSYIKRIRRNTSIVDFKKEVNDNTIKFLKNGKEVKEGLIGTGMVLVRNEIEYKVYVSGDLNGNGTLDTQDISMVIETSKNIANTEDERIKADINEDGFVTKDDVTLLSRAFIGEEYDLKEVSKYEVPTIEILGGTKGENDWYTEVVSIATDGDKYRIRGTNPSELTDKKGTVNLEGFNAYKVESYKVGKEGNISGIASVVIKVDDREIEPMIELSTTEITSDPVVATVKFNKENVFVSNNDRSFEYTFYNEGAFTFEYFDITGRSGIKEISVDWFTDAVGKDGAWRYSRLNKDEIYLREYLGDSSDVVIPAEYDGLKVYGVGNNVAEYNIFNEYRHDYDMSSKHYVKSLTIENGIKEIGDYFMVNSYAPISLEIPDSIVRVGDYSFNESHLTSLKLGNSIEYIGTEAFAFAMLEPYEGDLVLPDSIKTINKRAFRGMEVNGNLVLSRSVEVIAEEAFSFVSFTGDLVIPSNVKRIEEFAFSYMTVNGRLIIEEGLTYIGECAFRETSFVGDISIPGTVETIDKWSFLNSQLSGNLTLGEGVKTIGQEAFNQNMISGDLVIPNSVENIEWAAFLANSFDGTLTLGSSLKDIGDEAFASNQFTGSLVIPDNVETIGWDAFFFNNFDGSLTLSNKLKVISSGAFSYNSFVNGVDSLVIPDSVERIESDAFSGSAWGTKLVLSKSLKYIGSGAFLGGVFEDDLIIPDSVETIDNNAFEYCVFSGDGDRASLVLGSSLKNIGSEAFRDSQFNGNLVIPDSVENVGDYAFYGVDFGGRLTLGDGIKSIGEYAFYSNEFFGDLIIPNNVTEIGEYAFSLNGFSYLSISDNMTVIKAGTFSQMGSLSRGVEFGDEIAHIYDQAFYGTTITGDIVLPNSLQHINSEAFLGAGSSGRIILNNGLMSIGDQAFANNEFYGEVNFPTSVEYIGNKAFANNSNLQGQLIVSNHPVLSIGADAFLNTQIAVIDN